MLPVEVFDLMLCQAGQFSIDIPLVTSLVIVFLPEPQGDAEDEDCGGGSQIKTVTDGIIRAIEWEDCTKRALETMSLSVETVGQLTSPS